jgi:hypothetical protein
MLFGISKTLSFYHRLITYPPHVISYDCKNEDRRKLLAYYFCIRVYRKEDTFFDIKN